MDHATLREAALELEHLPTLAVNVFEAVETIVLLWSRWMDVDPCVLRIH